jgi:hypothetical protein
MSPSVCPAFTTLSIMLSTTLDKTPNKRALSTEYEYRRLQVSVPILGIAARNDHRRNEEQLLAVRTNCQPRAY